MSMPGKDNVLIEMAGRMSAFGKLGNHKYSEKEPEKEWGNKTRV